MTYCVAMRLNTGLVFLSDSRTNAGVDHVSTYRKMSVFERSGDRVLVLMSSGNLAITQSVVQQLTDATTAENLWNVSSMSRAAHVVGEAVRSLSKRAAHCSRQHSL